jgi:hypothetical protein
MASMLKAGLVGHLFRIALAIVGAVATFEILADERVSIPPTRPIPDLPLHRGKYQEYVTPFGDTRTLTWEWQNDQFGMERVNDFDTAGVGV